MSSIDVIPAPAPSSFRRWQMTMKPAIWTFASCAIVRAARAFLLQIYKKSSHFLSQSCCDNLTRHWQHGVIHRRSAEEHCDNRNSSYSDWSSQPQICSCMLQVTPKKQTLNPKPRVTEANAPPGTTHPRSQPMLCECSNSQTG